MRARALRTRAAAKVSPSPYRRASSAPRRGTAASPRARLGPPRQLRSVRRSRPSSRARRCAARSRAWRRRASSALLRRSIVPSSWRERARHTSRARWSAIAYAARTPARPPRDCSAGRTGRRSRAPRNHFGQPDPFATVDGSQRSATGPRARAHPLRRAPRGRRCAARGSRRRSQPHRHAPRQRAREPPASPSRRRRHREQEMDVGPPVACRIPCRGAARATRSPRRRDRASRRAKRASTSASAT